MALIEATGDEIYVTYLEEGKELNKELIYTNLRTQLQSKPEFAWWGSPKDAKFGWKDWCKSENYGNYDFNNPIYWKLKEGSKIFQIDWKEMELDKSNTLLKYIKFRNWREEDLKDMPIEAKINILEHNVSDNDPIIDFVGMLNDEIVAVELLDSCIGHTFINNLEISFNSWDCESIVVVNSNCIVWKEGG